jgi:riboflavin kinase / FMN adenylyltransferase
MRYAGKIVKGRGEGKRIGVPTLNFEVPTGFTEKHGIYAGWAWIDGEKHPAAIHYGPAPTFGISESSLEAHLLRSFLSHSPETGEFELVQFLREIEDFKNIEDLQEQIRKDVEDTRHILGLH